MKIPDVTIANAKDLKTDGDNPNKMTKEQLEALKQNIRTYGFIIPIITNKNLLIADGEHRLRAAQQLNMQKVPIIKLPLKDVDRRILRQVLNKLKGQHDPDLDLPEYKKIIDEEISEGIVHPTMKPLRLITMTLINSSKKGDIILDACGGSGTTMIAAEKLDRKCYMMELEPEYVDTIIQRWEKATGKKAVLTNRKKTHS